MESTQPEAIAAPLPSWTSQSSQTLLDFTPHRYLRFSDTLASRLPPSQFSWFHSHKPGCCAVLSLPHWTSTSDTNEWHNFSATDSIAHSQKHGWLLLSSEWEWNKHPLLTSPLSLWTCPLLRVSLHSWRQGKCSSHRRTRSHSEGTHSLFSTWEWTSPPVRTTASGTVLSRMLGLWRNKDLSES